MNKELKTWRKLLAEEWRWFRKHGASLAAYIERYGKGTDPEPIRYGDGGELIFEADLAALRRKINIVIDMAKKRGNPSRRYIPQFVAVTDDGKALRRG